MILMFATQQIKGIFLFLAYKNIQNSRLSIDESIGINSRLGSKNLLEHRKDPIFWSKKW